MFKPIWNRDKLDWILEESQQIETPFFLWNESRFRNNVEFLKRKAGDDIAICYSVKANPWYVVGAAECADYLEVCSHGEWELCRRQEILPAKITVGGIYKSDKELKELVEAKPHRISIESMGQLSQVAKHASVCGIGADILLRISSGNQFGMDLDVVIDILKHQDRFPYLRFQGVHYYSGTQKKQAKEIEKDIGLLESVGSLSGGCFTEIQYGPGLGVPQFQNHMSSEYEYCLSDLINRLQKLAGQFKITLECGRLLTADTGIYVTEIVDKKNNKGRTYYIVDGGIHHLQYDGQMTGQHLPFIYAGKNQEMAEEQGVAVCGALCTTNDVLIRSASLPEKKPGQRLIFMNAGAYCATEGISLFLSRDLPGIVMERQGGLEIIRNHIASYPLNMKQ